MAIFDPKQKVIMSYQKAIDDKNKVINKYYDEIGRLYYGQYKDMSVDVTKSINAKCDSVSDLYTEIKDLELKILHERGLKLCKNCNKENMLAYAFCFACGNKFEDDNSLIDNEVKDDSIPSEAEDEEKKDIAES